MCCDHRPNVYGREGLWGMIARYYGFYSHATSVYASFPQINVVLGKLIILPLS